MGAATPLTRDEFIADQTTHAKKLRTAILADATAPVSLAVLAADEVQWVAGWLGALESAGLLRPLDEAAPIRDNAKVVSLNATLATGILLAKGGDNYRTQADILGFFAKVQQWYGDTAKYAGDPGAAKAPIEYIEVREDADGNRAEIPVPVMADKAAYDLNATQETHFINFNIYAGASTELEHLRHLGVTGEAQSLNLTQYLQQAAQQNADAKAVVSVRGPQASLGEDGKAYVPANTPLPYTLNFNNPTNGPVGQLRLVDQLDASLDPRSLRLGDLKLGDINVHIPSDKANFQGDFDFTGSKGFILRVSAGVDAETRIATWLLQAIDPDTGEVLHDATHGLLAPSVDGKNPTAQRGFVSYTILSSDAAISGAELITSARVLFDGAPPVDSEPSSVSLDAKAPTTAVAVTALGNNADGQPSFDVHWESVDDASGIKSVTVYVAEDGGDFRIWQRQIAPETTSALFAGVAGKRYEFLAVATDRAGNREAASVVNAVLPDDGGRQAILDALGVNETLTQTAELPLAAPDRNYVANALFAEATHQLPGQVAHSRAADLRTVLAPFTLRGLAEGYATSAGDIGAQAIVELADHSFLVSAGAGRNDVYRFGKDGGRNTTPLFSLDSPVLDMAIDSVGQLWIMSGAELLQVDADSGAILRRLKGPGGDPLTHALVISPQTGEIYVSSGNGVEIFKPAESDPAKAWKHFSNQRVGDLAFGPDNRLWAVKWTGSEIGAAQLNPTTDIISFPMSGRTVGRPELEFRLAGVIDSIAFGAAGGPFAGLLITANQLKQRPVVEGTNDTPHQSAVWMIELASRKVLQVATGGTRGEGLIVTTDGRILIAETGHIDEIAPRHAPLVKAVTVPDGALVPLPMNQIGVVFDQAMWLGDTGDAGSVLNPQNFTLTVLGANAGAVLNPNAVRWDALTHTAWLDVAGLEAGQYQLTIVSQLQSDVETPLEHNTVSTFMALNDMTSQLRLDFSNTRADRATGEISYDISITNIGTDDIKGPLTLLLDPGRYFGDAIADAQQGGGNQSDLWLLNLTTSLQGLGGKLAVGATLANQTVSIVNAGLFATRAGMADLIKANLGHGVYAAPQDNLPPVLTVAGAVDANAADADQLPPATAGQPWSAQIEVIDTDGTRFYWQLVQAPAGVTLTPPSDFTSDADGYHSVATLTWTPTAKVDANSEILVRVQDSRGGVALRRFQVEVAGGNHAPVMDGGYDLTLKEGESLTLPLTAADADGDRLTLSVRNLPPGAVFDAANGLLTWVPGYDQAGTYRDITVTASDGKTTASQRFNVTVEQGWAKPVLNAVPAQSLREGDSYALQLAGFVPGMLPNAAQADGTTVSLSYSTPWLPGGATLNAETGWFEWAPGFNQHGTYKMPVTLTATWVTLDGEVTETSVSRDIILNVANANGAPIFDAAETWNILEDQPLRVSVFAFDPDNPDFEPKIRLRPGADATGPETTAPTVSYQVTGLPEGAAFDAETMEVVWTPGYLQAGTYSITVTATDTGDAPQETPLGGDTGTPAISQLVFPIVVNNANRAPQIGDIGNAFVDKGSVIEIPVSVQDVDGDPVELSFAGLPRFAVFTRNPSADPSKVTGVLRFTPGEGDRGDYTITVTARDDGGNNVNQVLTEAKSFVLTVRSISEAAVITAPRQVVAVVGQPLSIPLLASDLDQDALAWTTEGLPLGAEITPAAQYGYATLTWTPEAGDIGAHDLDLIVTDLGLPPQDAGHVNPADPVPNVTRHALRIVVREANAAPDLLGLQVNGDTVDNSGDTIALNATEGVPLSLDLFGRDSDADLISWKIDGLPRGMSFTPAGNQVALAWTPDRFTAQDSNTGTAGLWRFTVTGSDGMAQFTRTVEITVANVNQTPKILPMPLQLVNEGETLNFTVRAGDIDNDALQLSLIHDENTPQGVFFDAATGYFEWTPDQNVVDNASVSNTPYTFTFKATDGTATTTQTVQVRVFDINRMPTVAVSNQAVAIGNTLSIPVAFGEASPFGISVSDADGAAQTQALVVSFANLPEGAAYDAQTRRLSWTPGPGQIGDTVVTAKAFDGKNTTSRTFTLRAVADIDANKPKILVSTTPSLPALPGQLIIASVRADAWSGIASIAVEMRAGENEPWQSIALDAAGRYRFTPDAPGLIDIRVTATDRDGFSAVDTHTVRIKNPTDTTAPQLAWAGVLSGSNAASEPATIQAITDLQATLSEAQLMGWRLQIAPVGNDAWRTLANVDYPASALNQDIGLANLDPQRFANGVYQLRLSAWDLAGRTTEIETRLIVDSAVKAPVTVATDALYTLGGHTLALTRLLTSNASSSMDFGNWTLPLLDTSLTSDQPATLESGVTAAWREGARVWLTVPESLSVAGAGQLALSFTLGTSSERLGIDAGAPQVWHPLFSNSQGWSLEAHAEAGATTPDALTRQGSHLHDQLTGLPWVPTTYTLIAPTGERYELDAQGKIQRIEFVDGAQWLVSDAGIAATDADGNPAERIDFVRNSQGQIARIAGVQEGNSDAESTVYRFAAQQVLLGDDAKNRLVLVRELNAPDNGTPYGYAADGKLLTDTLTANLGAPASWLNGSTNTWSGDLSGNAVIGFTVRDSEIASTVKVPGAQGALILAVETETADAITLDCVGGQVLGSSTTNGKRTTLIRVTEGGLKLIRLTGSGHASVKVSVAGDINNDGNIDGTDAALWQTTPADVNGDGAASATDRQLLFANTGYRANRAPTASSLPLLKTHADLANSTSLASIAEDNEGDTVFWRLLATTHGTARFSADGQQLIFTPEAGYVGEAKITLQADDGYTAGAPMELTVNVSGAKLTAIHLAPLASLMMGQGAAIKATLDFEDEKGVKLADAAYLTLEAADLAPLGKVGIGPLAVDDARDLIRATGQGPALIIVKRIDRDGRLVQAAAAINTQVAPLPVDPNASDEEGDYETESLTIQPDVYPGTLTLIPGGTRQLKVHLIDPDTGEQSDIHSASQTAFGGSAEQIIDYVDPDTGETSQITIPALPPVHSGTRYLVSDESIATVSADGLITALSSGRVTVSIVHLASIVDEYGFVTEQVIGQTDIALNVETAQVTDADDATPAPRSIVVSAQEGGAVSSATGETVLIGAGGFSADADVSIERIELTDLQVTTGLQAPGQGRSAVDADGNVVAQADLFQAVGAFTLNFDAEANVPLQLAIPVQGGAQAFSAQPRAPQAADDGVAHAGDTVYFFRKGQALDANGVQHPVWWLVDNGFIGADGVARTASPPYAGVLKPGEYIISRQIVGNQVVEIRGRSTQVFYDAAVGMAMSFASQIGLVPAYTSFAGIEVPTFYAGRDVQVFTYDLPANPQSMLITIPPATQQNLKPTFTIPTVVNRQVDESGIAAPLIDVGSLDFDKMDGSFSLKLLGFDPQPLSQVASPKIIVELVNAYGQTVIAADGKPAATTVAAAAATGTLRVKLPEGYAAGSVGVKVTLTYTTQAQPDANGDMVEGTPQRLSSEVARPRVSGAVSVTLSRTAATLWRTDGDNTAQIGSISAAEFDGSTNLPGYLTGAKVDAVAVSPDGTRAYVAGNGKVWGIDLIAGRIFTTIMLGDDARNIVSIKATADGFFAAEGNKYDSSGNYRLWYVSTTVGGKNYNQPIQVQNDVLKAGAPYGFAGMDITADGRTLVIAAPQTADGVRLRNAKDKAGDIYVIDLYNDFNTRTGKLAKLTKAELPSGRGFSPREIKVVKGDGSSSRNDRFMVTNTMDYNHGLATLTIDYSNGKISKAKVQSIDMRQTDKDVVFERTNIQRASDVVIVKQDGVEYAIVSDENYDFLDPYYQAMHEAPMFVQTSPFSPPTPIGGSASAKTVVVGGKLGIIRDPFGKAEYLGSTAPQGTANWITSMCTTYKTLTLLGNTLIVGTGLGSVTPVAFSVKELIKQAVASAEKNGDARLRVSIGKTAPRGVAPLEVTPSLVTAPANSGASIGSVVSGVWQVVQETFAAAWDYLTDKPAVSQPTSATPATPAESVSQVFRMGDVYTYDIAEQLSKLSKQDKKFQEATGIKNQEAAYFRAGATGGAVISLTTDTLQAMTGDVGKEISEVVNGKTVTHKEGGVKLATLDGKKIDAGVAAEGNAKLLSALANDSLLSTGAEFAKTGIVVMYRDITNDEEARLRAGKTLASSTGSLKVSLLVNGKSTTVELTVKFADYNPNGAVFFGDRDLKNPGYSAMTLKGEVKNGSTNKLDVLKVEQRLKYLGFMSYEKTHNNKVKEFVVDGKWDTTEDSALMGFYAATHYTSYGKGKGYEGSVAEPQARSVVAVTDTKSNENFNWLNAYNAPHLVNAYEALPIPFPKTNTPVNRFANGAGNKEAFTTSWVYDLLQRWRGVQDSFAALSDQTKALTSDHLKINGLTSPSGYDTKKFQHETGGHSTAMALDLGIVDNDKHFITRDDSRDSSNNEQAPPPMIGTNGWNYQNALDWSGLISNTTNPGERVALRNFLSLYSLTVTDGDKANQNGTWEEWTLVNGDAAKKALFGDGTQAKSMIQHVYVGDGPTKVKDKNGKTVFVPANFNSYPVILGVLKKLNVDAGNSNDHEHHFHIDFRTPDRVGITSPPKQLGASADQESLAALPADWVEQARKDFEQETGEIAMLTFDTTALPDAQVMVVAQAPRTSASTKERVLGICVPAGYIALEELNGGVNGINPARRAISYFKLYENRTFTESEYPDTVKDIQVVRQPAHGRVTYESIAGQKEVFWHYIPQTGYEGPDRVDFVVHVKGQPVRLVYYIQVTKKNLDTTPGEEFCKRNNWKISLPSTSPDIAALQQLIDATGLGDTVNVKTADLAGASLGETTAAQITLDIDAAGHGWFIDPTPTDNAEFLPTSNPNEWIAKEGSEAYGKMDLLTVLLHEYGHALGLEHSTDAHDFMATTLQPGVRRTLTVDEQLALMQLAGFFPTPDSPSAPYGPTDPGAPLPFTRVLNNARNARLRREEGLDALVPQFDTAANPKLTNPEFASAQGWATSGDVAFTNGAATLTETATTQTRLNQVFVLGENDRFLSFTLANTALGDQANGPRDAFEVALIDASTGLSLMGGTGLTHNDAIVNRQADGSEHNATGITVVNNADGSRTYLVDLAGIPAGTVVNLAFDLIGFGSGAAATNSHLTIRDLRLGVPQTADDAATLAEDSPVSIDALGNDLNARQPGFAPLVVSGPAHGQVAIDADGRFTYTPEANWNGTDSFTYKISDGHVDSNLATVTLTVTPVNDAPVIAARSVTLDEDGMAIVDLLAGASDVDGDALSVAITTAPQHGTLSQNADGTWSYVPDANWNGTDVVEYEVSDGTVATPTRLIFVVNAVNDAPAIAPHTITLDEDAQAVVDLLSGASDVDGDAVTVTITTAPQHGALSQNADGTWTYIPDANWNGTDVVEYEVSDGTTATPTRFTFVVNAVNDAPVIAPRTVTLDEDTRVIVDLLAGASDVDGDALSVAVTTAPQHGTLSQNADGTWSYAPEANWNGTDVVEYEVSDGTVATPTRFTFVVNAVNDAPVIAPRTVTLDEDTQAVVDLLAGASDVDGDALSVAITTAPQHGALSQNADGTWTYVPDADWNGTDVVEYEVSDGTTATPTRFTFVVNAVNDAPVLGDQALAGLEDTAVAGNLLATVSDVDNSVLTASIIAGPQHGQLVVNGDGSFTYTPDADWNGGDSFTYKVSDGELDSAIATVVLTVAAVNDAPVIAARSVTLDEDSTLIVDLLAGASDVDGDALTVAITAAPQHGTLTQNANGTWTYVPAANWNGTDAVDYTVGDGVAATPTRLTFVVNAVNDAPVVNPIAASLLEDGSITLNLLAGASDVDGDALSVTAGAAQHGALTRNADGSYTYRPDTDFNGADEFAFSVSDGQIASQSLVRLTITAVNDAPVARDDAATLNEDGRITLALMSNDSDVDGDSLMLRIVSQPAYGVLTLNADNTVTYVPVADFSGEDVFSYVVNDGQADSSLATVRLIVTPEADAPTLVLTDVAGQAKEIFRTGWERVANKNRTSTLVQDKALEGWTLLTRPDPSRGGSNGFEVWSSGDKMMDAGNKLRTVAAATGNGDNWLELNNSGGSMHQTLGIERTIETLAGATYTLSLDLAGRLGYSADYTKIGILVDGVRIGGDASTSPVSALDWQAKTFQFTGKGGKQTIRIVSEATRFDKNGRGMMLDDIALLETLPANTGLEDSAIRISAISAALRDVDGSETLAIRIEALPVGATLTDGTHTFTTSQDASTAEVTGWNLGKLSITPPQDFNGTMTLKVVATATEQANQASARSEASLTVTVLPVNDVPVFTSTPPAIFEMSLNTGEDIFQVGGAAGSTATLSLNWQSRDAAYNNEIGLYRVDDASGRIGDLKPGDAGYAAAALAADRAIVLFKSGEGTGAKATAELAAGQYVGFFLIQNASTAQWRSKNATNSIGKGPLAFFSAQSANPDRIDHLQGAWTSDGGLTLGWEDLTHGGDRDFDDAIVGASGFARPNTAFTYKAKAADVDGDTLTWRLLEGPKGARIDAATGLLTWDKPRFGSQTFRIEVSDGKGGKTEQRFTVNFGGGEGDDRCAGKAASITVRAAFAPDKERSCDDDDRFIVINQGNSRAPVAKVDWSGASTSGLCGAVVKNEAWMADLLGAKAKEKSLAEMTGLTVRVER